MQNWYINGIDMVGRGILVKTGYSASCAAVSRAVYSGGCGLYVATAAKIGLKTITIPLRIVRKTTEEADSARSWLLSQCIGRETEIVLPNGKQYKCALTKAQKPEKQAEGIIDLKLEFSGFQHGELVTSSALMLFCASTVPETPFKITSTAAQDGDFSVAGITFSDVEIGDVVCIDGMTGTIKINGQPADMGKNNFVSFPTLAPGRNTIACDNSSEISYYPIFF